MTTRQWIQLKRNLEIQFFDQDNLEDFKFKFITRIHRRDVYAQVEEYVENQEKPNTIQNNVEWTAIKSQTQMQQPAEV